MKILQLTLLITAIFFQSCQFKRVTKLQENGFFQSYKKAEIIVSKKVDLDKMKKLLVVPTDKYLLRMAKNIQYFDKVITIRAYKAGIKKYTKDDNPIQVIGKEGMMQLYNNYWHYLWLRTFSHNEENHYTELKLINPENFEELFVARMEFHYIPGAAGYNTYRPLFNALIQYIQENSSTYRK